MIYHFGTCTLDGEREQLCRGGEVIAIEPQVLRVLRYLLVHRGRVVSRDELLEQCWLDTYVSDSSLSNCMSRVREAIGQRRGEAILIETVPRRGYCFVGEVFEATSPSAPTSPLDMVLSPVQGAGEQASKPQTEPIISPPLADADAAAPPILDDSAPGGMPPSIPTPLPAAPSPAALTERRHLSVLSCRLCEAEALAEQLDPDDHYELLQGFLSICRAAVAPYEGHVVQQSIDGVVVYFGYPKTHEDEALRAVRSGLVLAASVGRELTALSRSGASLAVQVGIASGMILIDSELGPDTSPTLGAGRVLTQARRLGALADPGAVVISGATAQLVSGYVECKVREPAPHADGAASEVAYSVLGESALQTPLEVRAARGLTSFVGREVEVALLQDRWAYVQEGMGQVAWIQGEAGLGKSRLVDVLKETVAGKPVLILECRCSPYHQHTAFYPIIDWFQRALHAQSGASPGSPLEALEGLLGSYDLALDEVVPLLAGLLSLSLPEGRYALLNLTPQRQRERTLAVLWSLLQVQASTAPLLFVLEDMHWIDPSTLDFLQLVLTQVASESMLVVLTSRPAFEAPWGQRSEMTPVVLHRLNRAQSEAMIAEVAGGKTLPSVVLAQVVEKTDGVPLFVEELTRMVLESGQLVEQHGQYELRGELSALMIPLTLHDSLMARLDRLGVGKDIAQWGSVLGREFSYEVLQAVTPYDQETLQGGLQELVESELVFQRGLLAQSRYRFKHALIQDAAYDALPRRRRQAMHGQIVQVLEQQFPSLVETQPELLAHHCSEAGLTEQAIPYWHQAGQRAMARLAYQETIAHLTKELNLLLTLPASPERDKRELELQLALGYPLEIVKGQGAVEMEQAYTRALELCERVGDTSQHILALRGLHGWFLSRGELQTAKRFAEQAFNLAQQETGAAFLPLTHMSLGVTLYYLGEFAPARRHSEQGFVNHKALSGPLSDDRNLSVCPVYEALSLWILGYPKQAFQKSQANIARARTWDHKFRQVFTFHFMALLHQCLRDIQTVQELTEVVLTICQKEWFPLYGAYAMMLQGWLLAEHGQAAEAMPRLQEGLRVYRDIGSKVSLPYWLSLQAESYRKLGQVASGLDVLSEALELTHHDDAGHWWKAELYRLQGEMLLHAEILRGEKPESCFQQALDVARYQQAKSLELRAVMSLARLWQQQEQHREAYELLKSVYQWFTEGFDTVDLIEAKHLLGELDTS